MLTIKDVYDENELKSHNPNLRFLQEVDKRTGYRTKQMLVAPVIDGANGAAYKVAPRVFSDLGADVVPIGCSPNGRNINVFVGNRRRALLWSALDLEQILIRINRFDVLENG